MLAARGGAYPWRHNCYDIIYLCFCLLAVTTIIICPRLLTTGAGGYRFKERHAVGLYACAPPKWSDLFQLQTKMFHNGPSIVQFGGGHFAVPHTADFIVVITITSVFHQ